MIFGSLGRPAPARRTLHAMPQPFALLASHVEATGEHGLDDAAVDRLASAIETFGAGARHNLPRAHDDVDELGEWG